MIVQDLKPSNIGVSEDSEIKILDFGLGRPMGDQMTGYVMTRYWRAPEIMLNWMHYGQKGKWEKGCGHGREKWAQFNVGRETLRTVLRVRTRSWNVKFTGC